MIYSAKVTGAQPDITMSDPTPQLNPAGGDESRDRVRVEGGMEYGAGVGVGRGGGG